MAFLLASCGSKTPWNPYLSMKEKPSEQQMRENQKVTARGNKAYAQQMEENKKNIRDNNDAFFKMRKHYKHGKVKKKRQARR